MRIAQKVSEKTALTFSASFDILATSIHRRKGLPFFIKICKALESVSRICFKRDMRVWITREKLDDKECSTTTLVRPEAFPSADDELNFSLPCGLGMGHVCLLPGLGNGGRGGTPTKTRPLRLF